ncbi:hypothetical protein GDO81_007704 [Engystomops pustulosus]|uniref:Uncharacterized protein n=1 Tax=Engystomops pustulosus TaxID=76066 RepID=A0AAV7C914_ENGPU|nr:hypothetical protein GDO81_007704 [Engystomops pustulosus]
MQDVKTQQAMSFHPAPPCPPGGSSGGNSSIWGPNAAYDIPLPGLLEGWRPHMDRDFTGETPNCPPEFSQHMEHDVVNPA